MKQAICIFSFVAVMLATTAHAAITGTGGSETFAGIPKADAAILSFPTDLTGWTSLTGSTVSTGQGVLYDTTAGGGTLDSAAFTGTTPERTSDVIIYKSFNGNGSFVGLQSPAVGPVALGAKTTWTYYFAQVSSAPLGTVAQVGRYQLLGMISFPNAANPLQILGMVLVPAGAPAAGGDVQVYNGTRNTAYPGISSTAQLGNNVGAGQADATDYLMGVWQRVDVEITLTANGAGSAVVKYNGATLQTIALSDTGDLRTQVFYSAAGDFVQGDTTLRRTFIDDVSATIEAAAGVNWVDYWQRY